MGEVKKKKRRSSQIFPTICPNLKAQFTNKESTHVFKKTEPKQTQREKWKQTLPKQKAYRADYSIWDLKKIVVKKPAATEEVLDHRHKIKSS